MGYLEQPARDSRAQDGDASQAIPCPYSPHSLRATSATLLPGTGVDIRKVQELLGHRHITTTQIYDKRRIAAAFGALPRHAHLITPGTTNIGVRFMTDSAMTPTCSSLLIMTAPHRVYLPASVMPVDKEGNVSADHSCSNQHPEPDNC